jgi:RimJ/RimL family protein N-acetyltransferase
MIEIENYRARLIDSEDIGFLNQIRLSSHVQNNVETHLFTNNILQKDWIEKISRSNKEKYLILELKNSENYDKIGLICLTDIDFINRSISVGGHILEDFSSKGHGKKMYEIIFKICFNVWNMNRVWLIVLKKNQKAINLYNKINFIVDGVLRKAVFKNGKYEDYLLMSILQEEYINSLNKQ